MARNTAVLLDLVILFQNAWEYYSNTLLIYHFKVFADTAATNYVVTSFQHFGDTVCINAQYRAIYT